MTKYDALNGVHKMNVEPIAHERAMPGIPQPSMLDLMRAAEQRGPDGVLEAACHLPEAQFTKLSQFCERVTRGRKR